MKYENAVKATRERLGLSRVALSDRVNLSYEYLRRLEEGTHKPSLEVARSLSRALGVAVDEVFPPREG